MNFKLICPRSRRAFRSADFEFEESPTFSHPYVTSDRSIYIHLVQKEEKKETFHQLFIFFISGIPWLSYFCPIPRPIPFRFFATLSFGTFSMISLFEKSLPFTFFFSFLVTSAFQLFFFWGKVIWLREHVLVDFFPPSQPPDMADRQTGGEM